MRPLARTLLLPVALSTFLAAATRAQTVHGTVEHIKVYGASLDGNLNGEPAERDVSVYLPPSYGDGTSRRYPVVYFLHGFTDSNAKWFGLETHWINLPEVLDQALADATTREMIVVMPNGHNRFGGSLYSNSVSVGDWETFVAVELVRYIDSHYRTLPEPEARGLAGHSAGGYGTLRIAMKMPGVFSAIYPMSSCCMEPNRNRNPQFMAEVARIQSADQLNGLNFFVLATLASSAAWAPNPSNPPFYGDLPMGDDETVTRVLEKFAANATLVMIDQYVPNLKRLNAIAFDAGTNDVGIFQATRRLDQVMTGFGIPHTYESYEGNHVNRVAERIRTKVMPFFSETLMFDQSP